MFFFVDEQNEDPPLIILLNYSTFLSIKNSFQGLRAHHKIFIFIERTHRNLQKTVQHMQSRAIVYCLHDARAV